MLHVTGSPKCPTCGRFQRRSNDQNKRYWKVLHELSERFRPMHTQYAPESWHMLFKGKFLGCDDIKLPNGKVFSQPKSTADLDKAEFGDYLTQVEAFAAQQGVFLDE